MRSVSSIHSGDDYISVIEVNGAGIASDFDSTDASSDNSFLSEDFAGFSIFSDHEL